MHIEQPKITFAQMVPANRLAVSVKLRNFVATIRKTLGRKLQFIMQIAKHSPEVLVKYGAI